MCIHDPKVFIVRKDVEDFVMAYELMEWNIVGNVERGYRLLNTFDGGAQMMTNKMYNDILEGLVL